MDRSANMRAIRSKGMKPELTVRSLVHRLGFRFRLHRKDLPGKPDLVFGPRKPLAFPRGAGENLPMLKTLFTTLVMVALPTLAADISGEWKGTAEGPNGTFERSFTFKVDGGKLTGETVSPYTGKSEIKDGKVDGDNVNFTITASIQGNTVQIKYEGKAAGGDIKLTSTFSGNSDFPPIQWTLKKAN